MYKEDVIYGKKTYDNCKCSYVAMCLNDDVLTIIWNDRHLNRTSHLSLKNIDSYDEIKDTISELIYGLDDMEEVFEVINDYLSSDEAYEYIDDVVEYETASMRSEVEINRYMGEALDRVWLVRTQDMFNNMLNGTESIQADILDECLKSVDVVCKKYDIDFKEPVSDWDYGYWSGILAALRWVMGDEKDFLDT